VIQNKVILCGYHWTGCEVLKHLVQRADVSDIAVYTHEPQRGVPDIREIAAEYGVWCTETPINEVQAPFGPDVIASVYYRLVIKRHVIDTVGGRIFNMHPSLLPRHRGCSSVPWSILEGDSVTGVTFHYIDEGIDTGNILLQTAIQIEDHETQASLFEKCMRNGVAFWPAAFELVKAGFSGVPQQGISCLHKRGVPFAGIIQPDWPLDTVERFIRAMFFPPYPCATFRGQPVATIEQFVQLRDSIDPLEHPI